MCKVYVQIHFFKKVSAHLRLYHSVRSTGQSYVTRNSQRADFPEIFHPMIVLQQVSIIDCNLEMVRFNQHLYFERFTTFKWENHLSFFLSPVIIQL